LVSGYFMLPETRNIDRKSEYKPESEPLLYTKHNNRSDDVGSSSSFIELVLSMITNTVSREVLGTVNGIGQTIASLSRAIGPALGGTLWAWSLNNNLGFPFDHHFIFVVIANTDQAFYASLRPKPTDQVFCASLRPNPIENSLTNLNQIL
ncbi:8762_t:CDS:2, partial [Ambispora gerdemannii]